MNRVLNIRDFGKSMVEVRKVYPNAVYVGRTMAQYGLVGGPLANVAGAKYKERNDQIAAFRCWLWEKLKEKDGVVLNALRAIGPDTELVCWCAPLPCHAQVISKAAAWVREQGL